jgi:hypothetical protein
LLFTVGYSPYFFDSHGTSETPIPEPRPLSPYQSPDRDTVDALIHLASDHPRAVIEAEEALFGQVTEPNGIFISGDLVAVFERSARRTGFVGPGLPAENQDAEGIPESRPVPEDSPLFMGFKGRFERNQPSEDYVTIQDGPFSGGTTQQLSSLSLRLERWYNRDSRYQRVAKMFCPEHFEEGRVEGVGENLGNSSGVSGCPVPHRSAEQKGVVGHAQKASQARQEGVPPILRRDFNSTDHGKAGLHFNSLQERIEDFVNAREALNGDEIAEETPVGEVANNGILSYIRVRSPGNYLILPRDVRSIPMR